LSIVASSIIHRFHRSSLRDRVRAAVEYYPATLLFVHRDSEGVTREQRLEEIRDAVAGLGTPPLVEVVTVRMQEAWFLFDEQAIRAAASNPGGTDPLPLPPIATLEDLADPKGVLFALLRRASGLSGRHLRRFDPAKAAHRVADILDDSSLHALPAFTAYHAKASDVVRALEAR
jgi:hypothetical protein